MALALYRTYRPGRFADVVGQEHVTAPLVRAIEKNRVHHAYLFSGPRGCGKTSSARILARSLNCAQGPTSEPCGVCDSCVQLAPNGPGSLDVIELDAATHGLVEDARELRERAHFAPVSARYKIYIIDEAHQLGPGAANALLRIIEEPPAHVRFVFATTAPDKILPTIRSRTYHYPFRLVPARIMRSHLAWVCEQEGVPAEPTALDLVARAGAGSVRDALSVLGQLMAGADSSGVTYALAYEQLGFTDAALLDEVVTALATNEASGVFHAVDRVVESGHDPRRFLTDLLERLRDLLLVQTVPDALDTGLVTAPDDQAARLREQAAAFGRADLVRLAQVADEGVLAMRGTTPTRLQLELVCSRLLLPGADTGVADLHARADRMERQIADLHSSIASGAPTRPPSPRRAEPVPGSPTLAPDQPAPGLASDAPDAGGESSTEAPLDEAGLATIRRAWPEVLERLRELRKAPWTFVKDNTEPVDISGDTLVLGVRTAALRDRLVAREDYTAYLLTALTDVIGRALRVEAVVQPGGSAPPSPPAAASDAAPAGRGTTRPARPPRASPGETMTAPEASEPATLDLSSPQASPAERHRRGPSSTTGRPETPRAETGRPETPRAETGRPETPRAETRLTEPGSAQQIRDDVDPDDPILDDTSGADLLTRELGASIIDVVDET